MDKEIPTMDAHVWIVRGFTELHVPPDDEVNEQFEYYIYGDNIPQVEQCAREVAAEKYPTHEIRVTGITLAINGGFIFDSQKEVF